MNKDQQISNIGNALGEVLFTAFNNFINNQKSKSDRYDDKSIKIEDSDFDGYLAAILFFIKNVAYGFSLSLEDFMEFLFINLEGTQFIYEADITRHSTLN
jgi:hypothetical protein